MTIVIVNWLNDNKDMYIDGRIPLFEHPLQTGYWIPYEQTDLFVKLALCDDNVSSVTVYSYKEYFRK